MTNIHTFNERVFYDATDAAGVMYQADYLRFMDHARSDFLHANNFDLGQILTEDAMVFAVANINIQYHAPAKLGQMLSTTAQIIQLGRASISFHQTVCREQQHNSTLETLKLATAEIKLVNVNTETFRPVAIPSALRKVLERAL